jgi:NTP pyrophosphatase (non-canonical NTP hydrolase)
LRSSLRDLTNEMVRARIKFPRPYWLGSALAEEVGEVAEAMEKLLPELPDGLPHAFMNLAKHLGDLHRKLLQRRSSDEVRKEALQVACVAMRIYEEGDPLYDNVDDEAAKP